MYPFVEIKKQWKILDYGCGGGKLIKKLRQAGYNAAGTDIREFPEPFIHPCTENRTPFDDNAFDIIFSNQVMEHCKNVDAYFKEAQRVLKPNRKMLCEFPHKFIPFDSHARLWFVHWFPKLIRMAFYWIFRREPVRREGYVFLRNTFWYKKIIGSYFEIENITVKRMELVNLNAYKGNAFVTAVRKICQNTGMFRYLSFFAIQSWVLTSKKLD